MSDTFTAYCRGQKIEWWFSGRLWYCKNFSTGQRGVGETKDDAFEDMQKDKIDKRKANTEQEG